MTPDISRPVTLIDLSALYHQAYSVVPETDPISKVHEIVLRSVAKAADVVPGAYVAICCDSKTNWRKDISPEYKAQREKKPRSFFSAFDDLKERLRKDARLLWEADGFEADDVIATAADALTLAGHKVTIVSPDKDLSQLVSSACSIVSTAYDPWVTRGIDEIVAKFGVTPSQFSALLALCGDKSDNIKGAEGIGVTTAALLINTFGGIDKIYEAAKNMPDVATNPFWRTADGKHPLAMHGALLAAEADVRLAAKLVSLRYDAPIKIEQLYEYREIQPLTTTDVDFEDMISPGPGVQDSIPSPSRPSVEEKPNPAAPELSAPAPAATVPPAAAGQGSTALATVDKQAIAYGQFDENLQPTGMYGLKLLAQMMITSRYSGTFTTPEKLVTVFLRGKDLGLSPTAAMMLLQEISGKLTIPAQTLVGMAKRSPDCEYFYLEDVSPKGATAVTKRKGSPKEERRTFTVEMAQAAGLVRPGGGWAKNPEDMCVARASSKLARQVYPDATSGMYSFEEMGGND